MQYDSLTRKANHWVSSQLLPVLNTINWTSQSDLIWYLKNFFQNTRCCWKNRRLEPYLSRLGILEFYRREVSCRSLVGWSGKHPYLDLDFLWEAEKGVERGGRRQFREREKWIDWSIVGKNIFGSCDGRNWWGFKMLSNKKLTLVTWHLAAWAIERSLPVTSTLR